MHFMLVSHCACADYIYVVIFFVRYLPSFVRDVLASGRCSVNVWGAISAQGLGRLVRLPRAFNAAAYRNLLDEHLLPYICGGSFPADFFFIAAGPEPYTYCKDGENVLGRQEERTSTLSKMFGGQ
ncbi:hypothetical protein HPB48_014162 [Haemaphysalis longicornis]|uniref:Uncharacterized protein n=1 Tax=Haemaphysalis longicornis TaxID=44386 RepID=A0A9J6FKR8_HAELO|nr:hypothetical protein HPB48_014162 [Haemaphysalis longicornis]